MSTEHTGSTHNYVGGYHQDSKQDNQMQVDPYSQGNMYGNCAITNNNNIFHDTQFNGYNNGNMYMHGNNINHNQHTHNNHHRQRGRGIRRGRGRDRGRGRGMGRGRGSCGGRMHRVDIINRGSQLLSNDYLPPNQTGRSLTKENKIEFRDIGCVVIKNGASNNLIEKSLRKINYSLGQGIHLENIAPHTGIPLFNNEFVRSAEMMNLFTQSDAYSLCADLFGSAPAKNNRCQLALRYPHNPQLTPANKSEYKEDEVNWHVDGLKNKVLPQFNVLLGIALSQQKMPFCGQFTVWPGTHYEIQKILIRDGYDRFWEKNHWPQGRSKWKDIEYKQCNVDVGDIILCHPFLCHKGGINYSMDIRYNIYYRIQHKDFYKMSDEQRINDLWIGLDGMKTVL